MSTAFIPPIRISSHKARKIDRIAYEEMLELASLGAKVLQDAFGRNGDAIPHAGSGLSTFANEIGSDLPGTLVTEEDKTMEKNIVTGIAYTRDEAKITLVKVADRPGVAASIFEPLARRASMSI